jgi:hypothetical protein
VDTARENADVTRFVVWFLPPGNMVVFHTHTAWAEGKMRLCIIHNMYILYCRSWWCEYILHYITMSYIRFNKKNISHKLPALTARTWLCVLFLKILIWRSLEMSADVFFPWIWDGASQCKLMSVKAVMRCLNADEPKQCESLGDHGCCMLWKVGRLKSRDARES